MPRGDIVSDADILRAYAEEGSIEKAAKALNVSYGAAQAALQRAKENVATLAHKRASIEVAPPGRACYIFTSAQNDTAIHEAFLTNLEAYAAEIGASIHISRFTYDVSSYGGRSVKAGQEKVGGEIRWHPRVEQYASDHRLRVAPDLEWCGEMNILPTAVRPLSGMQTYTGQASGIIPHVKMSMESTPRLLPSPPRFMYTTGAVTLPNYIQKKAGQKAEFHHVLGAMLVEVDHDGVWWARQINAAADGSFFDLTAYVADGLVFSDQKWAGVVLGDLHDAEKDAAAAMGSVDMIMCGRPKTVVVHDALDWRNQSHHDRNDPHARFAKHVRGHTSVTEELADLTATLRQLCLMVDQVVLTRSNHDEALDRWLREADYRQDPKNALVFLGAQIAVYREIARNPKFIPDALPLCLGVLATETESVLPENLRFLRRKERFEIAGIDVSQHGDEGPNGARAAPAAMERLAMKAILGHTHTAAIHDGVYWVGTLRKLDAEYTRGATSWSHTNCVIYPNGKRALVTLRGTKWRMV
jgi:hypothetical protein